MSDKTLVYSPEVRVVVISDGVTYDVSRDVVGGSVNRVVDAVSRATVNLSNKDSRYTNKFKRMDRIQISMKRVTWVTVFTGYLDSVPIFQLYPGMVRLRASCTLKRLLHTWWDTGLEASRELLGQRDADALQDFAQGEDEDDLGVSSTKDGTSKDSTREDTNSTSGTKPRKAAGGGDTTDGTSQSLVDSDNPDAGMGMMLKRILTEVGGWTEEELHVQDVPMDFLDYLSENIDSYDQSDKIEQFKDIFSYNESFGMSGGGGGGGLGEATFSTIGPPANGDYYTDEELVAIVASGGWTGEDIDWGVAIILAESSGKPGATNPNNPNGTIDRGLWQINSIHEWRLNPGENWFDPAVSTRLARDIYRDAGNSWQPWSTYSHWGTAQPLLARAKAARAKGIPPLPKGSTTKGGTTTTTGSKKPTKGKPSNLSAGGTGLPSKDTLARGEDKAPNPKDKPETGGKDYNIAESPSPAPSADGTTGQQYLAQLGGKAPNTDGMRVYESIAAVALYKFPMMTLTSGARFTDNGYHSKYMAADISNGGSAGTPEMKQLAQWWYDNFFGKGLLELIHSPFNNNVGMDTNVGDGMTQYYNPSTMAGHRDHVHIAMSGVVSVDGTSDGIPGVGGMSGGTFENKLGKALFNFIFDPANIDPEGRSSLYEGERAPVNDEPLIQTVQSVCSASMRSFQSSPDGKFVAFYPDYFGVDGSDAVLKLEDIEIKNLQVESNDDALTTHLYVQANPQYNPSARSGDLGWLDTKGVATVENEWLFKRLTANSVVAPEFTAAEDLLRRYGVRPVKVPMSDAVSTPQAEFLAAAKLFMRKWAEQYFTPVEFTFMPELFPGMRVELVGHGVTVYAEQVTHTFSYESGFTTSAVLCAPSVTKGSAKRIDGTGYAGNTNVNLPSDPGRGDAK